MNDYYEVRIDFSPCTPDMTDYMAALLADAGYESFVPDDTGMSAYIKADVYNAPDVDEAIASMPFASDISYKATFVEGRDWNAEWEKNYFKPIVIEDECVVHSTFHTDVPQAKYDIVIDPKMAFGTGHHATTSLIIAQLLRLDLTGKSVIDMGTGTGILAILAAMRGATDVVGVEIDPFAYANAIDNVALNSHQEIKLFNGDASVLASLSPCDVFIANINRNVITADLKLYADALKSGGTMLLSGFYEHDIPVVEAEAVKYGLVIEGHTIKGQDHWTCLCLRKSSAE